MFCKLSRFNEFCQKQARGFCIFFIPPTYLKCYNKKQERFIHLKISSQKDVFMRILIISDEESPYIWNAADNFLKTIDFTISCGDLKSEYLRFIVTMTNKPLFYVHGNHDANYLRNPPDGCDCIDERVVEYNGFKFMGLGGSKKYKKGPFQYTNKEMNLRYLKLKHKLVFNKQLDFLITHSPAKGLGDGDDFAHVGFDTFNKILDKYQPQYHLHGHYHLNYGNCERILKYKNTTIINGYGYYVLEI